jgi:Flp pilus assembly protein TadG
MTSYFVRLRGFVTIFRADTSGVIMPYVALMLVVFVGLGALALDGGRYMSMSTQMQAAADSLALAGARELDGQAGSRQRATDAINAMVTNGLTGLGYGAALAHATPQFYNALPAVGSGGFTGTPATSDYDARFVAVTVNPVTIATVMPIPFFKSGAASNFSTGGFAVAGFKNRAVCGVSPVFVCNPYETSGMTDAQATAALYHALDPNDPSYNAATRRKMFRMDATKTSPGHFGWLQFTANFDGCNPNSKPCLDKLVAYDDSSLARMCVDGSGVQMATGNKPVATSFNDRFDIYGANGPSTQFTPSINVRKGYWLNGSTNWCNAVPGDVLSHQNDANFSLASPVQTTATQLANKNATSIHVASFTGILNGMSVVLGSGATASVIATVNGTPTTSTVTTSKLLAQVANGASLNFVWLTAPLPLDKQWSGLCSGGTCLQGNGDWDCANYWKINHSQSDGVTLKSPYPTGCNSTPPTASRYDVYQAENAAAGDSSTATPIIDYSGIPRGNTVSPIKGENGAPLCAARSNFTPTFNSQYDPRVVNVAVINCLAQTALGNIGGGNSGPPTPVAAFAQLFLAQPYNSDGAQYLYGELTGLINSLNGNRIFNQVQLYR